MFAALGGAASAHALASQPCSARAGLYGLQREAAQQELQHAHMQSSVNIKVNEEQAEAQQPLIKKKSGLRRPQAALCNATAFL